MHNLHLFTSKFIFAVKVRNMISALDSRPLLPPPSMALKKISILKIESSIVWHYY